MSEFEASGAYRPEQATEAAEAGLAVVGLKEHCLPREDSVAGLRSRPDAVVSPRCVSESAPGDTRNPSTANSDFGHQEPRCDGGIEVLPTPVIFCRTFIGCDIF
jgi:hypothetical protein